MVTPSINMNLIQKIIVSHIARIKSFRNNITEESITRIYTVGFKTMAITIFTGNVLMSFGIPYSIVTNPHLQRKYGVADGIGVYIASIFALTFWSASKATIYGMMWPFFVPYALSRQLLMKRSEANIWTFNSMWNVNSNGLMPHFLPMWSLISF
jgi:hypothetical protein